MQNIYEYISLLAILFIVFIIVFIVFNLKNIIRLEAMTNNSKNINKKNYIFAYGSLTNYNVQKLLLEKTKKRWPIATLKKEFGYSRHWIDNSKGGITLGIFKSKQPSDINGIIIEVSDNDLREIDKYEIYSPTSNHIKKRINLKYIKTNINIKPNDNLFVYMPNTIYNQVDYKSYIPNIYVNTCMDGFSLYGEDYLDKFLKTTS